jgi:hypothetical protein
MIQFPVFVLFLFVIYQFGLELEAVVELPFRECVLFIGTQFSILYTSMYSPAEAATPRA